ncbi:MAG TPA: ABC-2 family transporter protein [Ilumatobacter sp.]|nr:ABC-2 family transporter protein [Ilumatobacter sp.]
MNTLRLIWLHLRVNVMNEFQYRANLVIQLIQSMLAAGTGLVALSLIFDRTPTLNGWTRPELLVVMGVYMFVGGVIGFAIQPAMNRIMSDVEHGTFDYVLTKPVDSQVLASVREFRLWELTDSMVGVGVIVWGLTEVGAQLGPGEWASFVLAMVAGTIALYCLWLIPTCGAFWFTRMRDIQDLYTGFYRAGQYPITVYPRWLRLTLTYLVPIGLAVTVPSQTVTGQMTATRLFAMSGFIVAALAVTRLVWRVGTRRYSGASA